MYLHRTVFSPSLLSAIFTTTLILQVSQWAPAHRTLEMAGKISPSCKWNGMFPFRSVATKKVEQLRRLSVCSGKFPPEPLFPFAFQPVEPESLAKWKASQENAVSSPKCWWLRRGALSSECGRLLKVNETRVLILSNTLKLDVQWQRKAVAKAIE